MSAFIDVGTRKVIARRLQSVVSPRAKFQHVQIQMTKLPLPLLIPHASEAARRAQVRHQA